MSHRYSLLRLSSPGPRRIGVIRKCYNGFLLIIMLLSFPAFIALVGYSLWEHYELWQHGVEKRVFVIALDHTTHAPKAGSTFYYRLEMDGRVFTKDFKVKLPIQRSITMLASTDDPDHLTPGSRKSSYFELLSASLGGKWITLLLILFMPVIGIILPFCFMELLRIWRKMLNS